MNGGEVLEALRRVAPAAAGRLVFMTGAGGDVTTSGVLVLSKPVELSRIRELIDVA